MRQTRGTTMDSYLRTYRKHACFSQNELAFLFGHSSDTKVSRVERRHRHPDSEMVLGSIVIFKKHAHEVFPGFYAEVEQGILTRADSLREKLESTQATAKTIRKIELLSDLLRREDAH